VNDKGVILGMLTVGFYHAPTGKKAWIEDVVVDDNYRGLGVGKNLTNFAIQFTKDQQADVVMLTSKPSRVSANNLYKKVGFEQRETNVYRIVQPNFFHYITRIFQYFFARMVLLYVYLHEQI
jgi:ribosomal protein S18 acetylase RimI-like enzyme